MRNITYVIICWLLAFALPMKSQVQVEQKIEPIGMYIGQQVQMTVGVTTSKESKVEFPHFERAQFIVPGVEVLASQDDTTEVDDNLMKITRRYVLTSFDENLYAIPPMQVKVNGKAYQGNQLALKVVDIENVDTLHPNQFFPAKDVQNNPFLWSDWAGTFWLSLLMLVLCALAYYLHIRLKENKPIITRIRIIKRLLPHQKALNEIEKIKTERMVVSENQKEYYTKLTDTLRKYIEERFGFSAMEMTSSEIIYRLRESGDQKMIDELKDLFNTADLVKFAKYQTLINENDLNLVNAINFIDQTKIEGEATEERIVPKLSDDDKKNKKNRLTIKILLWTMVLVVAALFIYIIYNVWTLLG
jgi:hypothetical protein